MAGRSDPEIQERTTEITCPGADVLSDCRCRPAVERAFSGMLLKGCSESDALEVAERVYRYHHPELPVAQAREVVQIWVYRGQFH